MANRPIFIPKTKSLGVQTKNIDFTWHAGMATSQKQKSIRSLHERAVREGSVERILEISTKSEIELGKKTSAFSLFVETKNGVFPLESVYHASKIFPVVGAQKDWMKLSARQSKKESQKFQELYGKPIGFRIYDTEYFEKPYNLGFTYMYFQSLKLKKEELNQLCFFDAFTDINFVPRKGGNCQAHAAALFVSMRQNGLQKPWEIELEDLEKHLNNNQNQLKTKI